VTQPTDPSDLAAAQASDPTTAPQLLADIAYQRPDLRAAVAANPAAYPGLVEWLGSLGDTQVDAVIAARGPAPQQPAAQAQTPAAPEQAAPLAPAVPEAAQQPPAQGAAPAQPLGHAPGAENAAVPGAAPAYGAVPGDPAYGAGTGYTGAPGAAPGYPAPDGSVPQGFGAPGFGGAGFEGQPLTPVTAKKSRAGVWIGLGAAAVVLIGGGAFAANKLWFSKVGGAASASESVTRFADALSDRDLVAAYGVTSPAEISYLEDGTKMFASYFDGVDGFKDLASDIDPKDYADVLTVTSKDLKVDADELDAVTSRVTVTDGTITIDVDADKVVELAKRYASTVDEISSAVSQGEEPFAVGDDEETEIRDSVERSFPLTVTIKGGAVHYESGSGDQDGDLDAKLSVISVKESGDWYVSPLLTITDYALGGEGSRGSLVDVEDVKGADTAQAAGAALITGTVKALKDGDIASIGDLLPYPERRVVAFAAGAIPADADASAKEALANLDAPTATFTERRKDSDHSWLELTELSATYSEQGVSATVTFKDGCLTIPGGTAPICLADSPGFAALGVDQLSLVAVHEDGGWFASPTLTTLDAYGLVLSKVVVLAKDGKLTSDWFTENFGGLTSLFGGALGGADASDLWGDSGSASGSGTGDPSTGDADSGTGDDTGSASGSGDTGAGAAQVTAELTKAATAVTAYLEDNPDTYYIDMADLKDYGYTMPEDQVWLMTVAVDGTKGTFCLAGTDIATYASAVSIDESGKVYANLTCS